MTLPPPPPAPSPAAPPAVPPPVTPPQERGTSLLRASRVMAAGTVASRGTGLLRTLVIAAVVGFGTSGNAYVLANTLPNIVYELLLGGVLTSVIVPLLVRAAKHDPDQGVAYAQRLLTLVAVSLAVASVIGILFAPALVDLYSDKNTGPVERSLAIEFSRYFLPQIAFYGIGATMGAILNTRHRFAAPMWAPVLNNLVVLATGVAVLLMPGAKGTGHNILLSHQQVVVLAIGTTLGVVVQTVALVPPLRRTGFRWRPRFDFRHSGLGTAGRMGSWVALYVLANQLGLLVVVNLASGTLTHVSGSGSYATYVNAFVIFSLPHAIVTVSVITALLPRMSRHVVEGRSDLLPREMSVGLRMSSVILVPATFALVVLAQPIAEVLFGHGAVTEADARVLGWTLATFALGLIPFSAFQLHLRAFYALGDTRTPAYICIVINAVNVLADLVLYVTLHGSARLAGLAGGYALSYVVGVCFTGGVLSRRLGSLEGRRVIRTLVRLAIASAVGAAVAWAIASVVGQLAGHHFGGSLLALALALPAGGLVMVRIATRLHVREVSQLLAAMLGRAGRPRTLRV